jgi:hypothetical protein
MTMTSQIVNSFPTSRNVPDTFCFLDGYRGSIATGTRFKMQSSAPAMTESIRLVIETPAESAIPRIMDSS